MPCLDVIDRLSATAEGLELRRRVFVEVLTMVTSVRCDPRVSFDDELDTLERVVMRHEVATATRIDQLVNPPLRLEA